MRDFAVEANFPTSQYCPLTPFVKKYFVGLLLSKGLHNQGRLTAAGVFSMGKEVRIVELCAATGTFELLAGDVLGAAAKCVVLLSALDALLVGTARTHSQLVVGDCRFCCSAYR